MECQNNSDSVESISGQAVPIVNFAKLEYLTCPNKFKINIYSDFVVSNSNEKSCT